MKKIIIILMLAILPGALLAKESVSSHLLNGLDKNAFIAYLIFGYVGMVLNIVSDIVRRKPESIESPTALSWKYWFSDNKQRLITSIIIIPVGIILFKEYTDIGISNLGAFMIGLTSDHLLEILKRKNVIPNAG